MKISEKNSAVPATRIPDLTRHVTLLSRQNSPAGLARWLVRLLVCITLNTVLQAAGATSQSVSLAWDRSSDTNVTGYIVYMGNVSGNYPVTNNVGQATNATVSGLQQGGTYYFVVTAYTSSGIQSVPSNEIVYRVPDPALNPQISRVAGSFNIKFSATSGKTYVVEYKDALTETTWKTLTSFAGTNGLATVSDSTSALASRFYRIGAH